MHVWDLVGINGISWVLLVHGCQQAMHSQDHILPLWPPLVVYTHNKQVLLVICKWPVMWGASKQKYGTWQAADYYAQRARIAILSVLCLLTGSVGCRGWAANARYSELATAVGHQTVSVSAWSSRHYSDTGLNGFRETIGRLFVNYSLTFPSVYPHVPPRGPLDGFPWNLIVLWKNLPRKFQILFQSDENIGQLTWGPK
jgi:hypothetical protein